MVSSEGLGRLIQASGSFCVLADRCYEDLWRARMDDFIQDLESFRTDNGKVAELGESVDDVSSVEAQYVGAIKIERALLITLLASYLEGIHDADTVEASNLKNLYMTRFIQDYIDAGGIVTPVYIDGGWIEVDTSEDLQVYSAYSSSELSRLGFLCADTSTR